MKIRNGFVSNSSSSSFIVAFPKKPESVEEVKQLVFGDEDHFPDPYSDIHHGHAGWPAIQVAETIFRDIKKSEPLSSDEIAEHFSTGMLYPAGINLGDDSDKPAYPYDAYRQDEPTRSRLLAEYEEALEKYTAAAAKKFVKESQGAVFYEFHYSDNDGEYFTALEHGDVFRRLPYYRISHH